MGNSSPARVLPRCSVACHTVNSDSMTFGWIEMMRLCFFMRWISCLLRTAACSMRWRFLFESLFGLASRALSAASMALSPVA